MTNTPLEVPNETLVARLRQTVADQAVRIVDLESLVEHLARFQPPEAEVSLPDGPEVTD